MTRILRYLLKKFYLLVAIVLISLAVLVQAGRSFSHTLADYRQDISEYLTQRLNAKVQIGAIRANWEELQPLVEADNIVITSHSGEPVLALEKAMMRLDLLRSIINFRLVWQGINLHQVDLEFEQTANGFWEIPGLRLREEKEPQKVAQLDVLVDMLLLSRHIEFHQSHMDFRFLNGERISLDSPSVRLENIGGFHRLSLRIDIEDHKEAVTLVMEGQGDPRNRKQFRAKGYLQLNDFPTSDPLAAAGALLLPGIDDLRWRSKGSLNTRLWFSTRKNGEGFNLIGNLGLQTLSLPVLGRQLEFARFNTNIKGYWFPDAGWRLALQNIHADVNETRIENLNIAASATGLKRPIRLQSDHLDLQTWTQILNDAGALGSDKIQTTVLGLRARGELRNINVTLPLDKPKEWKLQANAHQLGVDAMGGVPALTSVDGFIEATQTGGFIDVDSRNGFSMHYVPLYKEPMVYDRISGQVAWHLQPEKNQIYVNSGPLRLQQGREHATGYLWLSLPWKRNTGDIDLYLQVGARDLKAQQYTKYTPALVPDSLLNWLEKSIGADNTGLVSETGFVYRGTLNTKNGMARSHQLYLDIDDAELNYHADWPSLSAVKGRLLLDDNYVSASVSAGKVYSSDLKNVEVRSRPNPKGNGALLTVKGNIDGTANDGLRVLRESMLRKAIGDSMDEWSLQGEMQASIDLAVPLDAQASGARQNVNVDLDVASFALKNFDLNIENLQGRISYNNKKGLSSKKLTATLFDESITANLSSLMQEDQDAQTIVEVSGSVKNHTLAHWSHRPELLFLDGSIPYTTRIELIHRKKADASSAAPEDESSSSTATDDVLANILVTSNLNNVAVDLPAPYGKAPEEQRELAVGIHIHQQTSLIDVEYHYATESEQAPSFVDSSISQTDQINSPLQALFTINRSNSQLLGGNIALSGSAQIPEEPSLALTGYLPEFDTSQWQSVLERYQRYTRQVQAEEDKPVELAVLQDPFTIDATSINGVERAPEKKSDENALVAGLPFRAEITLGRHQIGPMALKNIALNIMRDAGVWFLQFENPTVAGSLRLPDDDSVPKELTLQYVHLTQSLVDQKETSSSEESVAFDPRTLPLANVTVNELHVDQNNYGTWSAQVRPQENGVLFDNINGKIRGVTVSGVDPAAVKSNENIRGAQLFWEAGDSGLRTRFKGFLSADNMADVMRQWSKPDFIETASALYEVDLSWPGAPQDFALVNLKGDIRLSMRDGRFTRNSASGSEGLLRLFALINFDTLARRLRLDFSDLYKSGLAFDELKGVVSFDEGKMLFAEPLQVASPSSRLQMAGSVNLHKETIDARLIATLPVAGNLTFLAALATGLPAAAGVYLISKVFKKQVDQATSISYRIRGSWDEPQMKFDRLFEDENKLLESAERDSADVDSPTDASSENTAQENADL